MVRRKLNQQTVGSNVSGILTARAKPIPCSGNSFP
jgi:hypothetical protein